MTTSGDIDYLTVDDLLGIAMTVLGDVPLRDAGLLASAAARPHTTAFGSQAYPTFAEKTASLMHSLARNHPLMDGNKRLAWAATRAFCLLNRRDLSYTVDDAEALVLSVAAGELDLAEISTWVTTRLFPNES